ncbi:murein L,D-transpeptidase [Thalassovita gelatinovora]|uniref:Murein L,D-transpeptidase n=1 Tax=Thalassovita gelatinovora TaxID=53501 RepID=A0A0P1FRZ1_THAGE|nr:L,D-transpeptidase family protein [Thalassovita gelatinovora]QIZ79445.1 L,D-transpeptidase family protein [Thalassovita gelatinovora]CUH62814.1 murein L,D-transpeptidase [Thalassovita gelatinovora]SEQ10643.1 Murein L,D-transpeptidase YcbB/YkuD [Thalassovita gelatinovora]
MLQMTRSGLARIAAVVVTACAISTISPAPASAQAQMTGFRQAVAEYASDDRQLAKFYRESNFGAVWTGEGADFLQRRKALITELSRVATHGLPQNRYDAAGLIEQMRTAKTPRDLGMLDVALSKAYLSYAHDVQSGIVIPSSVDKGIVREVNYHDRAELMSDLINGDAAEVMRALAPHSPEYARLRKEMMRLHDLIALGGWGATVPGKKLEPGDQGASVIKLRDRLIAMGYLNRSATMSYDKTIEAAVQQFQSDHGLTPDGVAGTGTLTEINVPAEDRLKSVLVAMERERWMNMELGERHVLVNLTDFTAKIIDDGKVTFETRSVIGMKQLDRRSPEFSDVMEHMIINPTWNVPRSIAVKEYLPQLQKNPNAASHLRLTDVRGRLVDRGAVDFTQFNTRNFPFDMKQPPSSRNALGLVKFMFPNPQNVYLHDTPAKSLFGRESRAYSHGCIRLQQPFDFAYALLARQTDDPKGQFQSILKTGRETKVDLELQIPVHIIYRTATIPAKGKAIYRRDVYGRDALIWSELEQAGVVLGAVRG